MTPYAVVSAATPVEQTTKRELLALTRRLERAALRTRPPAVAATLQDARFVTERTREVYGGRQRGEAGRDRPARARLRDRDRAVTYGLSRDPHVVASCGRLLGI